MSAGSTTAYGRTRAAPISAAPWAQTLGVQPAARRPSGARFLLQALDWLNATWPHPQHRVHNGAADATKAGSLERCMLGAIVRR